MDNLKYYDTSLAYNFELFMPAEKKKAEREAKIRERAHAKANRSQAKSKRIRSAVIFEPR